MPRVFVAAVPRRRAACSARTLWCTSGSEKRAPKAPSSSLTFFAAPEAPITGASGIGANLDDRAGRAGHGAAHQQEVALGLDVDHLEPLLGRALVAHLAGATDALEHTRGRGGRADGARRSHVVRAMGLGAAGEGVALDRDLKAI